MNGGQIQPSQWRLVVACVENDHRALRIVAKMMAEELINSANREPPLWNIRDLPSVKPHRRDACR